MARSASTSAIDTRNLRISPALLEDFRDLVPRPRQRGRLYLDYLAAIDDLHRVGRVDLRAVWSVLGCARRDAHLTTDRRDVARVDAENRRLRRDLLDVQERLHRSLGAIRGDGDVRAGLEATDRAVELLLPALEPPPRETQIEVLRRARERLLRLDVPAALVGRASRCDGPLLLPLRRQKSPTN